MTSEKRPGKTRNQTVYRLTEPGREALREHLRAPAGWPRIQHDAARRLFAGDMITDQEILASLQALRNDIEQLTAITETNISRITGNPHRARYALLLHDLARVASGYQSGLVRGLLHRGIAAWSPPLHRLSASAGQPARDAP